MEALNNEVEQVVVELPTIESTKRTQFHVAIMKDFHAYQWYESITSGRRILFHGWLARRQL